MTVIAISGGASPSLEAFRALPRRSKGPGVLVIAGRDGLSEAVRSYCQRLAEDDYLVIGVASVQMRDARAALTALGAVADPGNKLAVVAFDEGADLALQLALVGEVDALIVHGDGARLPAVDPIRAIHVPIVVHLAGATEAQVESFVAAFAGRTNLRVFPYPGARPGFVLPGHAGYDRLVASLAHSRSLVVLRRVLGPEYDLAALFREHLRQEFVCQDADATMDTMVEQPYVNHIPTMTGGYGHAMLKRFYKHHFIPGIPQSRQNVIISEVVGADTVVLELLNCFTHDQVIDHILPGVAPTGKYVELPVVAIAKFKGDRLYYEHIYWDQASLLAQIGLLDPRGLPVAGREQAAKVRDPSLPANTLMANWASSADKP